MTSLPSEGKHPSVPSLAPIRPRRRGRRGGQKHQARRQRAAARLASAPPVQTRTVTRPLGTAPASTEELRLVLDIIADHRALRALADVCTTFEQLTPEALLLTRAAQALCAEKEEELARIGLRPGPLHIEDRVQILDRCYRLPDRTDAALAAVHELVLAMAQASPEPEEEVSVNHAHTAAHSSPEDMNGMTPLEDPGFFGRALNAARGAFGALRLPTVAEAAVGLAVIGVGTCIYLAVTGGESPTDAA